MIQASGARYSVFNAIILWFYQPTSGQQCSPDINTTGRGGRQHVE